MTTTIPARTPHQWDGSGSPAIAARGLTKRYGDVTAVHDLSFDVRPGRVTGFLGPNGAGKSTTLRMLLGLVRPTGGQGTVLGPALRCPRAADASSRGRPGDAELPPAAHRP